MSDLSEYINLSNNQHDGAALDDYGPTYDTGSGGLNDPVVQIIPDEARWGGSAHPWKVSLALEENGSWTASLVLGKVYDGLLSVTELDDSLEWEDATVADGNIIYLEYFYDNDGVPPAPFLLLGIATDDSEFDPPYDDDGEDPPVITNVRYPLAKIVVDVDSEEVPQPLIVEQMALNNLALTTICYDGKPLKYFLSL